ncbi:hypothetical protein SB748_27175 [Rhizobium sp. SIMBA_035]
MSDGIVVVKSQMPYAGEGSIARLFVAAFVPPLVSLAMKAGDRELANSANGEMRHAHLIGHRFEQATERLVISGVLQDITSRKHAKAGLSYARSELAPVAGPLRLTRFSPPSLTRQVNQPLARVLANANIYLLMLSVDQPNLDVARMTAERLIKDSIPLLR